ncbi:uncharacterized protein DNG_07753 [Cephalotrichum gorgonifer]|uniref:Monopolin complex subunit Csm1/Pcs1 C-terminal domain-containing protein n=1 Tax=Cephalotrichum gorgonifer TaxID=2041049 RepID=A0AAE8SXR5_9PEZI|nr:uncharacterized protein DNG_07753 [Cephalotrichum gorgonifer]
MPAAKPRAALMRMVDSDLEDESSVFSVADKPKAAATPIMPAKKPRGRPAGTTNKVTKPAQKSASLRTSGRLGAVAIAEIQESPEVLSKDCSQQNVQGRRKGANDIVPDTAEKRKPTRGRPRGKKAVVESVDIGHKEEEGEGEEEEDTIAMGIESPEPAPRPKGRLGRNPKSAKTEIPATQLPEDMDVDEEEYDELDELPSRSSTESARAPVTRGTVPSSVKSQRTVDVDAGDPSLRRRLGELTKKYEALESRYRQLQEVGTKEAERNFDRFKKQADERAQTSKELISNLKAELAAQTSLAKENPKLEKRIEHQEATISSLQEKITELTTSLSGSRAENKTLSTRLAASRSAEVSLAKIPGSAVKANGQCMRNGLNSEVIQTAQMKEDLYSDLTGLIVRGVKVHDKEDVFDCLQTGRNGTLHFKLSIETDITGDGFEEAQVTYQPQLDPSRDRALVDMLPDYLAEDITFPRPHAAKFYSRVTKALMEQVE